MKPFIKIFIVSGLLTAAAAAQTFTGIVTNGTTQKPAAGDEVTLLKLSQGMDEVATTKTNGRGEFKVSGDGANDPKVRYLVRVTHANVPYHQPVPPGQDNLQITVYDSAPQVAGVKLMEQSDVFQARDNAIQAIALFRISNASTPPLTQPSFEFYLPEGADVRMGQAISESGMPVTSAPVPTKEKNKYAFQFPLRPGTTQFEVVYTLPYSGSISLSPKLAMNADHYYVITAKGISFSPKAGIFQTLNQWPTDTSITGIDVHAIGGARAGQQIAYQLAGTGMLPQTTAQTQGNDQPQEDTRPGGGLGVPNEKPDPLHSGQWLFLGVLCLFLAAGATYVYTSNQPVAPVASARQPQDRGGLLLEAMKEEIFQLETDRLQGKISPKDYESAKAALDKTLQRAVQRQKT